MDVPSELLSEIIYKPTLFYDMDIYDDGFTGKQAFCLWWLTFNEQTGTKT